MHFLYPLLMYDTADNDSILIIRWDVANISDWRVKMKCLDT